MFADVLPALFLATRCRAEARDSGVETDSAAHQPGKPRGDGRQVPADAQGSQPGKYLAEQAEDIPTVTGLSLTIFAEQVALI